MARNENAAINIGTIIVVACSLSKTSFINRRSSVNEIYETKTSEKKIALLGD